MALPVPLGEPVVDAVFVDVVLALAVVVALLVSVELADTEEPKDMEGEGEPVPLGVTDCEGGTNAHTQRQILVKYR